MDIHEDFMLAARKFVEQGVTIESIAAELQRQYRAGFADAARSQDWREDFRRGDAGHPDNDMGM